MKRLIVAFVLTIFCLVSSTVFSADGAYRVSLEIREGGELRSAPMTIVRAGTDASVEKDGEGWFKLQFSVSPTASGTVEFNAHYQSATSAMAPMMEMEPGKTASMAFDDVEISVTVEPTDA